MSDYLKELFSHQEWADAGHWRAFEAYPRALEDKAICERLLHIHQVQRAFLWVVGPRTGGFVFKKLEDFASIAAVRSYAMEGHAAFAELLIGLNEEQLEENVEASFFKQPFPLRRRHALTQAAMHSHYHRGQNATRLRELGGVPPTTDFIIWLRNGQPKAVWP